MILASNSLAAAPDASSRQYNLCRVSQGSAYLASVHVAHWLAQLSHGLSAQRRATVQPSAPVAVITEAVSVQAHDSPPFCLKV
ncbi:hypothetical protein [Kordiimonas aquimaris]|uniref:hypothetical protein n=1 Tax=Kordiimonas aquimaris TaxID=707591 RepID=UPI0021D139AE|nr:hypothetical protein [Kordiimonas aquimaris]